MNDYFAPRVLVTESGCWEWQLSRVPGGYGQATMRARHNRPVGAHRLSYELHRGPIPDGMTVDHLCFNPPCVNPEHLRLLTPVENSANQRAAYITHCKRGHEYTPENTRARGHNGKRSCKSCHRERQARRFHDPVAKAARPGAPIGERVHTATLTAEAVRILRRRHAAGESASALARECGMHTSSVWAAVTGRTWKHVTDYAPSATTTGDTA